MANIPQDCQAMCEERFRKLYGGNMVPPGFSGRVSLKNQPVCGPSVPNRPEIFRNREYVLQLTPYTFRTPPPNPVRGGARPGAQNSQVRAPPFYILLDHTVAVLYTLFSKDQREPDHPLGITQLHWALYFLKGIRDSSGQVAPDMQIATRLVEDQLIELYADMSEVVMNATDPTGCMVCAVRATAPPRPCTVCSGASLNRAPPARRTTTRTTSPDQQHGKSYYPAAVLNKTYTVDKSTKQDTYNNFKPLMSSTIQEENAERNVPARNVPARGNIRDEIRELRELATQLSEQAFKTAGSSRDTLARLKSIERLIMENRQNNYNPHHHTRP